MCLPFQFEEWNVIHNYGHFSYPFALPRAFHKHHSAGFCSSACWHVTPASCPILKLYQSELDHSASYFSHRPLLLMSALGWNPFLPRLCSAPCDPIVTDTLSCCRGGWAACLGFLVDIRGSLDGSRHRLHTEMWWSCWGWLGTSWN